MAQVDGNKGITVNVWDYKTTKKPTGVTYALKAYVDKLVEEGKAKLTDGSISKEEWEKTVKVLDEIKAARGAEGVSIFGSDWGHTKAGDITFSADETEKLWEAMGIELTQTTATESTKTKTEQSSSTAKKSKTPAAKTLTAEQQKLVDLGIPENIVTAGDDDKIKEYAQEHNIKLPERKTPDTEHVQNQPEKTEQQELSPEEQLKSLGIPEDVISQGDDAIRKYAQEHEITLPEKKEPS